MRTTVRLPADLLLRAKARAASDNVTLPALIEEGLPFVLDPPRTIRQAVMPRVSAVSGRQLMDTTKASELLEQLDEDLPLEKRR